MGLFVRWAVRGVLGLISLLLFVAGLGDLPASVSNQVAFVSSFGGEWILRIVALLLGTLVALAAVGPARLKTWRLTLSEWWNRDAIQIKQLEADNKQLVSRNEALQDQLRVSEGRGESKIVIQLEEEGPVNPYQYDSYGVHCLIPYTPHDSPPTIEVEDKESVYLIAVSYMVKNDGDIRYQTESSFRVATRLELIDYYKIGVENEHEYRIKDKLICEGSGNVHKNYRTGQYLSWRYTVSCTSTLSGIPKGTYGLRIFDFAQAHGGREYRNMSLVITKLS